MEETEIKIHLNITKKLRQDTPLAPCWMCPDVAGMLTVPQQD